MTNEIKPAYNPYIGDYKPIINKIAFHKYNNVFIPCLVTNYYFEPKKYTLVPTDDLGMLPEERRCFATTKIYLPDGYEI
jgi:hypothetical protein